MCLVGWFASAVEPEINEALPRPLLTSTDRRESAVMAAAVAAVRENLYIFPHSRVHAMGYETINVTPVTPRIGAEVDGLTLAKPLSNRQVEELHQALAEHQVLFFRDQPLDVEGHKAFGRYFGDLHIHPNTPGPEGHPEILPIHADAQFQAHRRGILAFRRLLRRGAAVGQHSVPPHRAACRWRYAVRQPVCRLRRI